MTIASEITRLQNDKSAICTAIENKGVTVGSVTLDSYAACIDAIEQKGTYCLDMLLVGGGGSGGVGYTYCGGGGGGGGGVLELTKQIVTDTTFAITVGNGGASKPSSCGGCSGNTSNGNKGGDSCIVSSDLNTVVAVCGGGGGCGAPLGGATINACTSGGSGGGASGIGTNISSTKYRFGGEHIGNSLGNNGGSVSVFSCCGINCLGGGGGGAGGQGYTNNSYNCYGRGGDGICPSCWGVNTLAYGGGGGGPSCCGTSLGGGCGGCGAKAGCNATVIGSGGGGGGGASGCCMASGAGYKGIVKLRYPSNGDYGFSCATGGTKSSTTISGVSYCIHTFTTSGTFTIVS